MSRAVRALGALITLTVLLVVVPTALVQFVGRPWPAVIPPLPTMWRAIRSGDISDAFVIKALALIVWISWVRLVVSVFVELVSRATHRDTPRIGVLGASQRWAAGLVAAIVLLAAGSNPASAASASTSRSAAVRNLPSSLLVTTREMLPPPVREGAGTPSSAVLAGRVAPSAAAPTATREHIVSRYESFWSIAEDALGDGSRWREIVALNAGRVVAPGEVFDGTASRLLPGWSLLVPDPDGASVTSGPVVVEEQQATTVPPPTVPPPTVPPPTVVVERGDSLSSIAAHQVGDASRWTELWDANRGRELGGRVFDDPNLILTGWELIVPAAFGLAPPEDAAPPAEVLVTPQLPVTADPAAQPPPAQPPAADAPAPAPASTSPSPPPPSPLPPVPTSVTSVTTAADAGPTPTTGEIPVTTHPTPRVSHVDAEKVSDVTAGARITPPAPTVDAPVAATNPADDDAANMTLGGLGAAVLLAGGVITAVDISRRRQLRAAGVNARLAASTDAVAPVEVQLRRLNAAERIARVEVVVRALAHQLLESSPGARVLGVLLGADGELDALLSRASRQVPAPWIGVSEHRWRLPAHVSLGALAAHSRRADQPCPAIAHIGATMLDGDRPAELFVDLEAIGLLGVGGPADVAVSIVRAIAAGVAMSPMAETAHMILVGIEPAVLGHPLMQMADTLDEAVELAAVAVGATASVATRGLTTFELRTRQHGGEAWEPAIVFAAEHTGSPSVDELLRLTDLGGRGLSVVVAAELDAAWWKLRPADGHWRLEPLGIDVVPVGLGTADLGRVQALVRSTREPVVAPTREPSVTDVAPAPVAELPWRLMVRLLGPVDVIDLDERVAYFERMKAVELIVWLSQHRKRSTRTAARTALWESDVRDATFANVVSDARRNLARLVSPPDGSEWIGRTLTEDLPLHPLVVTDADVLENRLAASRGQRSERAIAMLRPALALIRDMPFAGTNYLWPDAEGITSQLTLMATTAAAILAGHYLSNGDTAGVFWATGQGLKVLPGHEELISLRMRAYSRQGDLAGVRHEWESYERVLNGEAWSDGEPSPKLVALRRELLSLR